MHAGLLRDKFGTPHRVDLRAAPSPRAVARGMLSRAREFEERRSSYRCYAPPSVAALPETESETAAALVEDCSNANSELRLWLACAAGVKSHRLDACMEVAERLGVDTVSDLHKVDIARAFPEAIASDVTRALSATRHRSYARAAPHAACTALLCGLALVLGLTIGLAALPRPRAPSDAALLVTSPSPGVPTPPWPSPGLPKQAGGNGGTTQCTGSIGAVCCCTSQCGCSSVPTSASPPHDGNGTSASPGGGNWDIDVGGLGTAGGGYCQCNAACCCCSSCDCTGPGLTMHNSSIVVHGDLPARRRLRAALETRTRGLLAGRTRR